MVVKQRERFTYEKLVEGLKESKFKKIIVITGSGVVLSSGIPDLRKPETGIYDEIELEYRLPYTGALYSLTYFLDHPEAFY